MQYSIKPPKKFTVKDGKQNQIIIHEKYLA